MPDQGQRRARRSGRPHAGKPALTVRLAVVEADRVVSGNTDGTAVPWWSFTKTVIAAAILKLAAVGAVDLDATDPDTGCCLAQLLQHTAGLPDYGASEAYHSAVMGGEPPWTRDELLRRVGQVRLFEPGKGWAYSNLGYLALRERVEAVTGLSLAAALSELVFEPLAIDALVVETPEQAEPLAGLKPGYHPDWVYHGLAAGRVGEAARLLSGVLSGRLFPVELCDRMRRPLDLQVPLADRPWSTAGYGLGLMTPTVDGHLLFGHTGGGPSSSIAVYASGDRVAAAFGPGEHPQAVERAVVEALT